MLLSRILLIAPCFLLASTAMGAPREPVVAPRPDWIATAGSTYSPEERERARAEFIEARRAFSELLISTLTSDELIQQAGELSHRVRLKRETERLAEVTSRLREVERAGLGASDEAERLRTRAASLEEEVTRLQKTDPDPLGGESGKITARVVAGQLNNKMAEETAYLADVLEIEELRERSRRLRQLVTVARITGALRNLRQEPTPSDTTPSRIVPAGAEAPAEDVQPAGGSLGEGTSVPPESGAN